MGLGNYLELVAGLSNILIVSATGFIKVTPLVRSIFSLASSSC